MCIPSVRRADQDATDNRGYVMAVLLVALGVMAILLTAAMPVWRQISQREKEEELLFRGTQYSRAIGLYQRKYANASPTSIDVLVQQRFLRKKYVDPMVADGEFQLLHQAAQTPGPAAASGQPAGTPPSMPPTAGNQAAGAAGVGGIIGVASKSKQTSLKLYNGRSHYNEWQFVYLVRTTQPTAPQGGAGAPNPRGGGAGQPATGRGAPPPAGQPVPLGRPQPTDRPPARGVPPPGPVSPVFPPRQSPP